MIDLNKIKIDLKKPPRWLIQLGFIIFALVLIHMYNKKFPAKKQTPSSNYQEQQSIAGENAVIPGEMRITASAMCSEIRDGWPGDVRKTFSRHAGKVFCFSLVEGARQKTFIKHRWIYDNELITEINLPIESDSWRVWSSNIINPAYTGFWRVDIVSDTGEQLDIIGFTVD